jgi:hypothetical protein
MWHCDPCGWDGPEPDQQSGNHGPSWGRFTAILRVCPQCGEEVYETVILRQPPAPNPQEACDQPCAGRRPGAPRPRHGLGHGRADAQERNHDALVDWLVCRCALVHGERRLSG